MNPSSFRSNWRRALSPTGNVGDAVFRVLMFGAAALMCVIVILMIAALASHSLTSIRQFGFGFLTNRDWNPVNQQFGALAFVYGTIASSLIALLISVPLSLGIAIFLVEQAPTFLSRPLTFLVELLAAIPSVVYGLWGIFVLAPFLREHIEPHLARWFGWLPLFQGSNSRAGSGNWRDDGRHDGDRQSARDQSFIVSAFIHLGLGNR